MKILFLLNRDALTALYADMQKLTEDLLSSHMIRQKNFDEIQKSLQGVNAILKAASKLRGKSFSIGEIYIVELKKKKKLS